MPTYTPTQLRVRVHGPADLPKVGDGMWSVIVEGIDPDVVLILFHFPTEDVANSFANGFNPSSLFAVSGVTIPPTVPTSM